MELGIVEACFKSDFIIFILKIRTIRGSNEIQTANC